MDEKTTGDRGPKRKFLLNLASRPSPREGDLKFAPQAPADVEESAEQSSNADEESTESLPAPVEAVTAPSPRKAERYDHEKSVRDLALRTLRVMMNLDRIGLGATEGNAFYGHWLKDGNKGDDFLETFLTFIGWKKDKEAKGESYAVSDFDFSNVDGYDLDVDYADEIAGMVTVAGMSMPAFDIAEKMPVPARFYSNQREITELLRTHNTVALNVIEEGKYTVLGGFNPIVVTELCTLVKDRLRTEQCLPYVFGVRLDLAVWREVRQTHFKE